MRASLKRETKETSIEVSLDLEGSGLCRAETGIELLDRMLSDFAKASNFDLVVRARGDLETGGHHTTEDVGIALGSVLCKLIKEGMGSFAVPSGGCLAMAAARFGEPGYYGDIQFQAQELGGMALEDFCHFLRSMAYNGRFTLHVRAEGSDDRNKIQAVMAAVGRAIMGCKS